VKTLSALLSAGLTLSMLPSVVHATEYYRVEVMLFTYLDENSAREEHWPLLKERALAEEAAIQAALEEEISANAETETTGSAINDALQISEDQSSDLTSDTAEEVNTEEEGTENSSPVTLLDDLEFENAANRFGYRSDMKIVWHQAWIEELQDAENAIRHPIETGYEEENFRVLVKGDVRLHRSRYLHFTPNLEVDQEIFTLPDPEPVMITPVDINNQVSESTYQSYSSAQTLGSGNSNGDNAPAIFPQVSITPPPQPEWLPLRAAEVSLSRRMRSDELHYLDHPLLGMVIRVTPYEEPEQPEESENQQAVPAEAGAAE